MVDLSIIQYKTAQYIPTGGIYSFSVYINKLAKIIKATHDMTQLTQTIIERAKKYLQIKEDIDVFALYDLIYECLIRSHPDQFDESLKAEAEERFKTLNNYLSELKLEIESFKLRNKPSEIVLYEKKFEIVKTKNEVKLLHDEIEQLKLRYKNEIEQLNLKITEGLDNLKYKNYEIERLNNEIETLKNERYHESIEELRKLYKPTKSGLLTLGISSLLLLFMGITTQFDAFYQKLAKFSPIEPKIFNWILFIILIATFIGQLYRLFKKDKLRRICDKIISQNFIRKFYDKKVKIEDLKYTMYKSFTENDVEDYLREVFCSPNNSIEKFFLISDSKSINHMKDVFIDNLLKKKYISFGSNKDMNTNFVIK